jgi:hypothetical protein
VALHRQMATGLESPCYVCGRDILPEQMVIQKPSDRPPGFPDTFTVGGKGYVWVHEACSPLKGSGRNKHTSKSKVKKR